MSCLHKFYGGLRFIFKSNFNFCTRFSESEDLLVQIEVFEERKLEDEEEMLEFTGAEGIDIMDHKELFMTIFNKVHINNLACFVI